MLDAQEFIDLLEDENFDARAYSGRAMFGSECVGVTLESDGELWELAQALALAGHQVPPPRTDSLGRNMIAYWPSVKWPEPA